MLRSGRSAAPAMMRSWAAAVIRSAAAWTLRLQSSALRITRSRPGSPKYSYQFARDGSGAVSAACQTSGAGT